MEKESEAELIVSELNDKVFPRAQWGEDWAFSLVRLWDDGWSKQTMVVIPMRGHMNGGLGAQVISGLVGKYVRGEFVDGAFEQEEGERKGFCSIGFTREGEKIFFSQGPVSFSAFSFFEGVDCSLGDFLCDPLAHRLKESWTVSLVVSVFPWPLIQEGIQYSMSEISRSAEKHLWFFADDEFKHSLIFLGNKIAISSAWGFTLHEASSRALRNCQGLDLACIQYRTDACQSASEVWSEVEYLFDEDGK